jgi:hypothetical protein
MKIKKEIINGKLPSDVFKGLLLSKLAITNSDLASMFKEEFPEVSSESLQVIWKWKRPGKEHGISDDKLNQHILFLLGKSGYN